jgi:hypothetical protein
MTKLCLLAGNSEEAYRYSRLQNLEPEQWFYPKDINDLLFRTNFHVIVVGTAGMNTPASVFERIYQVALSRGKIGRL